ncbi:hypothetical protein E0Z10_g9716 [Xylaria hypoxylon]|uniref:Nephrocystin 3-like N-terminal domain-containing protein n=1 Tax=Xylaria hypoxylon TaxID=37992 RepID=A0A4Z0YN64_9PEZI|nr:hypothetical protein E0Z10_g9716 [Xylaria hypoxylon]
MANTLLSKRKFAESGVGAYDQIRPIRSIQPVQSVGLTLLCQPSKAEVDIILVHGLGGHPRETWTHRGDHEISEDIADDASQVDELGDSIFNDPDQEEEPYNPDDPFGFGAPRKSRRLNPGSGLYSAASEPQHSVYWPRDLLPDSAPYARILTYGYDTKAKGANSQSTSETALKDVAWDLLVSLETYRRDAEPTPVVFIAHSLGGSVVKEMLRRAASHRSRHPHLYQIFKSTVGVIFFGTPHGGADPRGFLHQVSRNVIKAGNLTTAPDEIDAFLPSTDSLQIAKDLFGLLAKKQQWKIHTFQESLGTSSLGGRKVLENDFSYMNFPGVETTQHIKNNHMDMCRFAGSADPEYKKLAAAVWAITSSALLKVKVDGGGERSTPSFAVRESFDNLAQQKEALMMSLKFDQLDARHMSIKIAYAETCKWLLTKREYMDWVDQNKLDEHHGLLWIKGKPGTGKSTLMKFALSEFRRAHKTRLAIYFFFNARGNYLEKSTLGLYRSLLFQLYQRIPKLQHAFVALGLATLKDTRLVEWTIEALEDLFEQTVRLLGSSSVVCFIDALDECGEGQVRDMVKFFQRLGDIAKAVNVGFWVFLTSRHYPHITISTGIHLTLDGQEGHTQDLVAYIDNMSAFGSTGRSENLKREIREKASGVFMWVVIVVEILNKEYDEGRSILRLEKSLSNIPSDLHQLFRDILTRDSRNKDELLLCIQWLLFSSQPLAPEELYFAILSGTESDQIQLWDREEASPDRIDKFILNCSKGLAESTRSSAPTVQFIHESVRDFLLKENGLLSVWSDLDASFQGTSHARLASCCQTYLRAELISPVMPHRMFEQELAKEAERLRQSIKHQAPFLGYAVCHVLYHAEMASEHGLRQRGFVESLSFSKWLEIHHVFRHDSCGYLSPNASIHYILARLNMVRLLKEYTDDINCWQVEAEQFGTPLFAALATGNDDMVKLLLKAQLEKTQPDSGLHDMLRNIANRTNIFTRMSPNFRYSMHRSLLAYAAEQGDEAVLACYLAAHASAVDRRDSDGRTPLSYAAQHSYQTIVRMLLEQASTFSVNTNSRSCTGRTPLSYAAEMGHEAVTQMLLGVDATDADSRSQSGRTPLSYAAEHGHCGVIRLLLRASDGAAVDSDSPDRHNRRTPLRFAVENGHKAAVKLLLATETVDIDSKSSAPEETCLTVAAKGGDEEMVGLLLEYGADARISGHCGQTPLFLATKHGHTAVVRCLLEAGIDVDTRDEQGWSPLMLAARSGYDELVRFLIEKNANIETSDEAWGRTALVWAAGEGHLCIVRFLRDRGANVTSTDKYGRTPVKWAMEQQHIEVAWALLDPNA